MGRVKGAEKWRLEGTGAPEGRLGEGKGSHAQRGKLGDHWEGRGWKGSVARFLLPSWAPGNLLRSRAWSSAHLGPLQPRRSRGSGREGKGSKSKGRTSGTGTPRGGWGRGGVPTSSGTHPRLGVQRWRGETLGETVGEGREGMEGNGAGAFPGHLGNGKPVGLLGPILCPQSLPAATQSPSPAPTHPPRALPLHSESPSETPSNTLGLNPTHTPSPRAHPPNSRTPHSRGLPFHVLLLPFCAGPKQRPHPTIERHLA